MYKKIAEHYEDELRDVLDYLKMAEETEDSTQRCIFRDIAKEEHEHATMLKHLLERDGESVLPDGTRGLEEEVERVTHEA